MAGKIDIAVARNLRAQGWTLPQIATRFDCTKQAVQQLLAYQQSPLRPGAKIRELLRRGYKDREIAAILGVAVVSVAYQRRKLD